MFNVFIYIYIYGICIFIHIYVHIYIHVLIIYICIYMFIYSVLKNIVLYYVNSAYKTIFSFVTCIMQMLFFFTDFDTSYTSQCFDLLGVFIARVFAYVSCTLTMYLNSFAPYQQSRIRAAFN